MRVEVKDRVSAVDARAWDALAGDDDPFAEHAFLRVLEDGGTVGGASGWTPRHVTVWEGDRLVGALPLYLKDHSFGEFIFDWSWADASFRGGVPYYPKLVAMAPVTPTTGRRLLRAADVDAREVAAAVVEGCFEVADQEGASSIHWLFLTDEERALLGADERLMRRLSFQFHWHNPGYATFEEFLGTFRSSLRKQVRKERRRVAESSVDVRVCPGTALSREQWALLHRFYRTTCGRYGSRSYLTEAFFREAADGLAHRAVVYFAYEGEEPVAASLNFEKGAHLYGRYWGCLEDRDFLHFELCYYRPIERAIDQDMRRFEAGAQGVHKLRRGLAPTPIHSLHWIRHPGLAQAVADFLPREALAVQRDMEELARHGPYRRDGT